MEVMEKGAKSESGTNGDQTEAKALELYMRISKVMLHPYSRNPFMYHAHSNYAFRCGSYDTMLSQPPFNNLRRHIVSWKMVHDTMTSTRSIWCTTKQTENHIHHNGIIGVLMKLEHTWPILTLAHQTAKWNEKHGVQT